MNSIESARQNCANANVDVTDYATNNRILFMIPHTFHESLIAKELKERLDQEELDPAFDPGQLLKEKILDNISSIQVLVFGNTGEVQAKTFCEKHIVGQFDTVALHTDIVENHMDAGCIFQEMERPSHIVMSELTRPSIVSPDHNPLAESHLSSSFVAYKKGVKG